MDILFELLESLSLLLILDLNTFLLLLDSSSSLLHSLGCLLLLLLESLLVSLNALSHLIVILFDSLLLEGKSLIFKGLFALSIDLVLSEFIHSAIVL